MGGCCEAPGKANGEDSPVVDTLQKDGTLKTLDSQHLETQHKNIMT